MGSLIWLLLATLGKKALSGWPLLAALVVKGLNASYRNKF